MDGNLRCYIDINTDNQIVSCFADAILGNHMIGQRDR